MLLHRTLCNGKDSKDSKIFSPVQLEVRDEIEMHDHSWLTTAEYEETTADVSHSDTYDTCDTLTMMLCSTQLDLDDGCSQ